MGYDGWSHWHLHDFARVLAQPRNAREQMLATKILKHTKPDGRIQTLAREEYGWNPDRETFFAPQ